MNDKGAIGNSSTAACVIVAVFLTVNPVTCSAEDTVCSCGSREPLEAYVSLQSGRDQRGHRHGECRWMQQPARDGAESSFNVNANGRVFREQTRIISGGLDDVNRLSADS